MLNRSILKSFIHSNDPSKVFTKINVYKNVHKINLCPNELHSILYTRFLIINEFLQNKGHITPSLATSCYAPITKATCYNYSAVNISDFSRLLKNNIKKMSNDLNKKDIFRESLKDHFNNIEATEYFLKFEENLYQDLITNRESRFMNEFCCLGEETKLFLERNIKTETFYEQLVSNNLVIAILLQPLLLYISADVYAVIKNLLF